MMDDSYRQFMDDSCTINKHPLKEDDSCHQFMDLSSMEQASSNDG